MDLGSMALEEQVLEHKFAGREQAPEKIGNWGTQEIPEVLVRIGKKNSSRPPAPYGGPHPRPSHGERVRARFPFWGPWQARIRLAKVAESGLEGGGRGARDKIIAFCFDTRASNTGMVQGVAFGLAKNSEKLFLVGRRHHAPRCPKGKGSSNHPGLFLGPLTLNLQTTRDRGPFGFLAERDGGNIGGTP
ncbi:hypothetical protein GWK47_017447 [Chionoecetes opilio]|uniref:Uncharacterized protein n=1 Tax=Chionoecetes opilio TaxID=41210 RepID=A0A8J4XSL0_CHIOP|nr:hypothetical protein GWK47_017447 [Chionoecetes opilio]